MYKMEFLSRKLKVLIPPVFNSIKSFKCMIPARCFHEEFTNADPKLLARDKETPGAVRSKYEIFQDKKSSIIFDVEEEKSRVEDIFENEHFKNPDSEFAGISLKRGRYGVIDIEELVEILRNDNAEDIFVCRVPKEIKFVDYMCIVTGKSYRHMRAMAEFTRKTYKVKRNDNDTLPRIEGENSKDWIALDLGNIALHIFSSDARKNYDLESLWSVGSKYDAESNKPQDSYLDLLERHSIYLKDIKPKI